MLNVETTWHSRLWLHLIKLDFQERCVDIIGRGREFALTLLAAAMFHAPKFMRS